MQAGGVSGAQQAGAALGVGGEAAPAKSAEGAHSQFGAVSAGPASASFFEEASITLSSLRKFKTKDSKEDKDLKKQLERLKETVPDMPGMEKMDKFLQQMQEAKKNGSLTKEQIKQFADEYSGDSTHQYLALDAFASMLEEIEGEDSPLAADLRAYNSEFYEENKMDIQVGINSSKTAADIAEKTGGTAQEYRDIMRDGGMRVPDLTTPLEAYQHAKEQSRSYDEIDSAIQMLMEGLSNEMAALKSPNMTSSADAAHLVHVRKRLEVVFGLRTIIEFSQQNENAIDRVLSRG
ncbi:HrpJ domain-containing protein [Sansalvadorimonas verongulae]|uniref:HrpJ domain-containing protein n=1 Tax=Sansalvadorimonas verongulae TaxID=2172824 RepID=UPI0012BB6329|nr:HrpJ domain-containing protein [Sansalvadorimonas verongulae]MTI14152.1 hypothetical protein [Sansalvadorimonas verongulae]